MEAGNFDLVTRFLTSGGVDKLFVYGSKPDDVNRDVTGDDGDEEVTSVGGWRADDLTITPTLINLKVIAISVVGIALKIVL